MSEQVEQTAREMGWRPEAEFRGDKAKWVDAETFVSRGEHFIPILRADRTKLQGEVAGLKAQLAETTALIAASQESIDELKKFYSEDTKRQVAKAKTDLLGDLKKAREDGDVDREEQIRDELENIRQAQAAPKAEPPAKEVKPTSQLDPITMAWIAENPWYSEKPRLRGMANGIAEELRAEGNKTTGRAFYDQIKERMAEFLEPEEKRPTSKVDGGRTSGSSGTTKKARGYADLPAEAKEACTSMESKLVGKGRAFKDVASWQANYATQYFAGESE